MIKTLMVSAMMILSSIGSSFAAEVPVPKPIPKPAIERYIVKNDMGGVVEQFKESLIYIEKNNMPISVEEKCASACTLILSTKYKLDFCVKPNVVFMFHQPYAALRMFGVAIPSNTITDIVDTERMWKNDFYAAYPEWVQKAIDMNGGVPSVMRGAKPSDTFDLKYADVKAYVKTCN